MNKSNKLTIMSKDNIELTCTLSPGSIIRIGLLYVCQINNDHEIKYKIGKFTKMLIDKYGISIKEYHNIVVHGDINYIHKCANCDSVITNINSIYGYNKVCNYSCAAKLLAKKRTLEGNHPFAREDVKRKHAATNSKRLKELAKTGDNPFQNAEFKKINGNRITERWNKLSSDGNHPYQSPRARANNSLIRYKEVISMDVYIHITPGIELVKVGISKDYKNRNINNPYGIHSILKNDPSMCIELECLIKENFCNKGTEIFEYNKLSDVIKFIKEFKINNNIN